jgi:hypothetical protein
LIPEVVESIVSSSSGLMPLSGFHVLRGCVTGGDGVALVDWLRPDGVCDGGGFHNPGPGKDYIRIKDIDTKKLKDINKKE